MSAQKKIEPSTDVGKRPVGRPKGSLSKLPTQPKDVYVETTLQRYREGKLAIPESDGSNTKSIQHLMQIMSISRSANVEDPETLLACFYKYIELCAENDMKVSNLAAYASMGITKKCASDWQLGKTRSTDRRYKELIEQVNIVCSMYRESLMADGKINPVVGLWWQKNFDHFTDQPQPEAESTSMLGEQKDSLELAKKYQDYSE